MMSRYWYLVLEGKFQVLRTQVIVSPFPMKEQNGIDAKIEQKGKKHSTTPTNYRSVVICDSDDGLLTTGKVFGSEKQL